VAQRDSPAATLSAFFPVILAAVLPADCKLRITGLLRFAMWAPFVVVDVGWVMMHSVFGEYVHMPLGVRYSI
jgi:hypothetical protein